MSLLQFMLKKIIILSSKDATERRNRASSDANRHLKKKERDYALLDYIPIVSHDWNLWQVPTKRHKVGSQLLINSLCVWANEFDILHLSLPYFPHHPQLWSINTQNTVLWVHIWPWQDHYAFTRVGTWHRKVWLRCVWCGLAISRVKHDITLCSQWECDIEKVFALPPPSYQLTRRAHASVH